MTECGADVVSRTEGNIACIATGPDTCGPPGSESRACSREGLPGNLGDPVVSTSVSRRQRIEAPASSSDEEPVNSNSPLPHDEQQSVVPPERTKGSGAGGTVGSRSTPIVPMKLANCRPREPVKGSGVPDYGAVEENHSETSCSGLCKRDFDG